MLPLTVNTGIPTLLNERDVSRITGLGVPTVRKWRYMGRGPKYVKLGASIRYKPEDITAWIESCPTGGTSA